MRFALLCALLLIGCDNPQTVANPKDNGIILQPSSKQPESGFCQGDNHCLAPLRCFEARCQVPPAVNGTNPQAAPKITLKALTDQEITLHLEVADDDNERRQGLMWRTRMAPQWGMLFVFPQEDYRSFWMKNTYIPLDMVFIDAHGYIVSIAENTTPLSMVPSYESTGPARYVLELNGGFAQQNGIKAGQKVYLHGVPGKHEPSIIR